jgi:hypothetical protein
LAVTASRVLGREVEFNEVLSCAYKASCTFLVYSFISTDNTVQKEQSMRYHSDDEIGVQGTIAALSLGSPATMTFRPKLDMEAKVEDDEEVVNEQAEENKSKSKKQPPVKPPPCLGFRILHVSNILCSSSPSF